MASIHFVSVDGSIELMIICIEAYVCIHGCYTSSPRARLQEPRARAMCAQETVQLFLPTGCFSSVVVPTLPSVSPSMVHEEKEWPASLEESRLESCEFVARAALEFADTSGSVAPHNFDISTLRTAEEESDTRPLRCT